MDFEAEAHRNISENEEQLESDDQGIKNQRKDQDLKCNVCGKNYENVNNLKVKLFIIKTLTHM